MLDPTFVPFAAALAADYAVERELGRGGMAVVLLATDRTHDRRVALKVLLPDVGAAIGRERFLREIRITAQLQHPHILPLYASGEAAGFLWYAMPYVAGGSLATRLAEEPQLPLPDALRIAGEVLAALAHAHAAGVIHRDIKPENILVGESGILVADFGIARASSAAGEKLTATGVALGTPHYMSPEQSMGDSVDPRSDVYSVGCVLYEMLAGEPPHTGPNWQAILTRRLTESPRPLRAVRPGVPAEVESVVHRSLALVAADRWPSAAAFGAVLEGAASAPTPNPVRHPGGPGGGPNPSARRPTVVESGAIAVMDFRNLTRDPAVDWLGSGIGETVTADLRRVADLRIVARDAVARALGERAGGTATVTEHEVATIGRALGARWLVWGGYQVLGPRVRITAQFSDVQSGEVVGAVKVDGALAEIFALQDRIVAGLLDTLKVPLTATDGARIAAPETHDLAAYEWYARGRQHFHRFDAAGFSEAERCFREALARDPTYALAHSGLGSVLMFRFIGRGAESDLAAGIVELEAARSLDPTLAEPLVWLTYAYSRQQRWAEALDAGAQAVALEPSNAMGHYFTGATMVAQGSIQHAPRLLADSIPALERTVTLDPSYQPAQMMLAWVRALRGEYEEAVTPLERALATERAGGGRAIRFVGAAVMRALLQVRMQEPEAAEATIDRALEWLDSAPHLYTDAFRALAHCVRGELLLRRGAPGDAVTAYRTARDIADAAPTAIAMGLHGIRARCGLARALVAVHALRDAREVLADADQHFATRTGSGFFPMWETADLHIAYDLALAHATCGQDDEAHRWMALARAWGWNDQGLLASDPAAQLLREGRPPAR